MLRFSLSPSTVRGATPERLIAWASAAGYDATGLRLRVAAVVLAETRALVASLGPRRLG